MKIMNMGASSLTNEQRAMLKTIQHATDMGNEIAWLMALKFNSTPPPERAQLLQTYIDDLHTFSEVVNKTFDEHRQLIAEIVDDLSSRLNERARAVPPSAPD